MDIFKKCFEYDMIKKMIADTVSCISYRTSLIYSSYLIVCRPERGSYPLPSGLSFCLSSESDLREDYCSIEAFLERLRLLRRRT